MKPKDCQDLYRSTYARLGYPLKEKHGIPRKEIAAAEKKLGICLPVALREYFLVAGRERRINRAYNRLCSLERLEHRRGKLVFLEENQGGVVWGLTVSRHQTDDPAVYQALADEEGPSNNWALEERKCSTFMVFMLHLQVTFAGGMPFVASGPAPLEQLAKLDNDWHFGGEVNHLRAYSRENQAVCFSVELPPFGLKGKRRFRRIYAGAPRMVEMQAIAADLNAEWDNWSWPSSSTR